MTRKQRRLTMIAAALTVLGIALGLVLVAMRDNIVFFYSPAEIAQKDIKPGTRMRLGGLVKTGSVERGADRSVTFVVSDGAGEVRVRYTGLLPDLFREGQGIVAEGRMGPNGVFMASEVLAKHDENYMPPEAAEAVKKAQSTNQKATSTIVNTK